MKNAIKISKVHNGYAIAQSGILQARNGTGLYYRTTTDLPDGQYSAKSLELHTAGYQVTPDSTGYPLDALPPIEPTVTIDADVVRRVALAMGKNDVRYYLNGVCLQPTRIIATDGHRAHWAAVTHSVPGEVIIPRDLVLALPKKGAITLNIHTASTDAKPIVSWGGYYMQAIHGKLPDIVRVTPKDENCSQPWDGAGLDACAKYHTLNKTKFGICAVHDGRVNAVTYPFPDKTATLVPIADTTMTLINGYHIKYLVDADTALHGAGTVVSEEVDRSLLVRGADISVLIMPCTV